MLCLTAGASQLVPRLIPRPTAWCSLVPLPLPSLSPPSSPLKTPHHATRPLSPPLLRHLRCRITKSSHPSTPHPQTPPPPPRHLLRSPLELETATNPPPKLHTPQPPPLPTLALPPNYLPPSSNHHPGKYTTVPHYQNREECLPEYKLACALRHIPPPPPQALRKFL